MTQRLAKNPDQPFAKVHYLNLRVALAVSGRLECYKLTYAHRNGQSHDLARCVMKDNII